MLIARRHRGFTLIELMVAISIVAVMMLLGLPAMSSLLQNSKLGSTAQSLQAGIQLARAEAIRRNQPVEFVMSNTTGAINSHAAANALVGNANGQAWAVRFVDADDNTYHLVEGKAALEGSGQANGSTSAVRLQGTASAPAPAFAGVITFNGLGSTTTNAEYQISIDNPSGGLCAPNGPMRCLQVIASPGGQVKVCDRLAASGDSRAC